MRSRRRYRYSLWLALVALGAGCEGPVGPVGPEGPQGPPGPRGPAGEVNVTQARGTIGASGAEQVRFDGYTLSLSGVDCWISDVGTVWLKVATDTNSGVACGAADVPGGLVVTVIAPVGWQYLIVVTSPASISGT